MRTALAPDIALLAARSGAPAPDEDIASGSDEEAWVHHSWLWSMIMYEEERRREEEKKRRKVCTTIYYSELMRLAFTLRNDILILYTDTRPSH
jgi:hypothetical protein